ncbi:MAG: fimbria/pilus outer membrane usher protein [Rhizomicrobium sp.]
MKRRCAITLAFASIVSAAHARGLLLEIWINGRDSHVVARIIERDGGLEVANADLANAGLAVARAGSRLLDAHTAIGAEEDGANQRLLLTVDPARLARRIVDLRPSITEDVTPADRGAMLRYDASATVSNPASRGLKTSAGAALALTLFDGDARLTATGFATAGLSSRGARLDTALEIDDPSLPRKLVFGDAITGGPAWTRAVRFAGVQIATDYSQQPGRITFPLPQYFGTAAVPSTVDVFVGASRVFTGRIDEGPFALDSLPVTTGGGTATVVVRDVFGRETSRTISLFTDPSLLAPGLTAYSLEAGLMRRGYGLSSADYATPFASGTWRHGFHAVTAELHGELARDFVQIGGGAGRTVGGFGLVSIAAAFSRRDSRDGGFASLDLAARNGAFSLFGNVAATIGHFTDLASLSGDAFPALRYEMGVSTALGRAGALSLNWVGQHSGAGSSDLVTGSYSRSFGGGVFLGVTALRDLADRNWEMEAFLNVPIGAGFLSGSVSEGSHRSVLQAGYARPANPDGGFGYSVLAATGSASRIEANAHWITDRGEIDGAFSRAAGETAFRADASGGLALLDGRLFATTPPDGAVALVKTGMPDVRVYRENRPVAVSDSAGEALLTGLSPYAANRIGVDPRDYPIDVDIADSERTVVPPRDAGVVVDLAPRIRAPFIAIVRLAGGGVPQIGAEVDVDGVTTPLIVGRDGEIYFGDLARPAFATIRMRDKDCRVRIAPPQHPRHRIPRIGPFVCSGNGDAI